MCLLSNSYIPPGFPNEPILTKRRFGQNFLLSQIEKSTLQILIWWDRSFGHKLEKCRALYLLSQMINHETKVNYRDSTKIWFTGKKLSLLWMLPPPWFYYVKKTREVAFWTFIRRQNHKPLSFFDIIKPRRGEHS